jgi:hypothetical protein
MTFDCVEKCPRRGDDGFPTRRSRAMHRIKCRYMRALECATFANPNLEDESERASKRRRTEDFSLDIGHEVCCSTIIVSITANSTGM